MESGSLACQRGEIIYTLTIPGRPKPKKRPRVTKSHTYNPNQKAENFILAKWVEKHGQVKIEGDIEMVCGFYYSDKRVADTSNLIKLVEDGISNSGGDKNEYKPFNDRQITKLHGYRVTGRDEEKTIIVIREV